MHIPEPWQAEAYNQVPDSENRIHSDDVARQYGFEGGLVPGVTVSAYLLHPAVVAWGLDWLARGRAHVVVHKPLYDGRRFCVEIDEASAQAYRARLVDEGAVHCASAEVDLPETLPPPPRRRGDPPVGDVDGVEPSRAGIERLRERGMGALRLVWDRGLPVAKYLRDERLMPELLCADRQGYANAAFVLGMTNWMFAANVRLGPWLHLETHSQHFAPIPLGTELIVEARVADAFEKKGHEFVDTDFAVFFPDDSAAAAIRLRAIYKLRATET